MTLTHETDSDFRRDYQTLDNYQALIVRWLRGANFGKCKNLYISNRGKGTSLFIEGFEPFMSKKNGPPSSLRLAILQNNAVRILTINDIFGIGEIAKRLGIEVIHTDIKDFRADGTIKNGIIQVKDK